MNEEVNLWDEIIDDELHKQIYNVGFQKGKLEERERIQRIIDKMDKDWNFKYSSEHIIGVKQLQKEIGDEK